MRRASVARATVLPPAVSEIAAVVGTRAGGRKNGCSNVAPTGRIAHSGRAASSPRSRIVPSLPARSGVAAVHGWPPNAVHRACSVTRSPARRPRMSIATGPSAKPVEVTLSEAWSALCAAPPQPASDAATRTVRSRPGRLTTRGPLTVFVMPVRRVGQLAGVRTGTTGTVRRHPRLDSPRTGPG